MQACFWYIFHNLASKTGHFWDFVELCCFPLTNAQKRINYSYMAIGKRYHFGAQRQHFYAPGNHWIPSAIHCFIANEEQ